MVLEVLHRSGTPADSVFENVAAEYCLRFQQDAVLRARSDTRVWSYQGLRR
jgi:hypothetical protein